MEKNTIWAIVLSTIVVIASFLLQPIIFGPQIEAAMQQQEIAAQEQKEKAEKENSVLIESEILQNDSEFVNAEIQENLNTLVEEKEAEMEDLVLDRVLHGNIGNRVAVLPVERPLSLHVVGGKRLGRRAAAVAALISGGVCGS